MVNRRAPGQGLCCNKCSCGDMAKSQRQPENLLELLLEDPLFMAHMARLWQGYSTALA